MGRRPAVLFDRAGNYEIGAIGTGLEAMGARGFKDLIVWQKAKELAITIYRITSENKAFERDLGLRDQMRKSSVSVASNIAEGDERDTDKESVRFFYIAKGSLAELRTQIEITYSIGYLTADLFEALDSDCQHLGKMIGRLIQVRRIKK
jgi:four helix bundle protein